MFRFWLSAVTSLLKLEPVCCSELVLVYPQVEPAANSTPGAVCLLAALAPCFAVCFTSVSPVRLRRRLFPAS